MIAREVVLKGRPVGRPVTADFTVVDKPVPALSEGQILVRNDWFSLDPSARLRMNDRPSNYLTPYALGAPLEGWAVGAVVDSRSSRFRPGFLRYSCSWVA